jgi:hypothetical protein
LGQVDGIGVQLDFESVWKMLGGRVNDDVPAGDEEKSFVA